MAVKPLPFDAKRPDNIVVMGQIIGPFGIKGWVKIKTFTEAPDGLLDYPVWHLHTGQGWQEFAVNEAEYRNTGLVARLAGFDDRTASETLKGIEIGVPREALPEAKAGEHYWADLIGLDVVNQQNELLGRVKELLQTGANDVVLVEGGGKERLIPYIESVIVGVDMERRRMVVDWGLDY